MKKIFTSACFITIFSAISAQVVWLDADTGNEMDDLYAIARLVKEAGIKIAGISSAHFNNPDLLVFEKWNAYETRGLNAVAESQRLNEEILNALGRTDIPHPVGADRQVGRAWGGKDPRDSPAARAIISAVKSLPEGQKLDIITIGAVTNLASAIILNPEIINKIRCFTLGASYKADKNIWNKNEFNVRNDLNGFDYILDCGGLDLTIMPLETAWPLQFDRDNTYSRLNENIEIERILKKRWMEQNPQDKNRIMWDLALVEAFLHPDKATLKEVMTPPENTQRIIKVFTNIDAESLSKDFWETVKQ
jgi:inosine-uridine nucleoside N-ribohydrolase